MIFVTTGNVSSEVVARLLERLAKAPTPLAETAGQSLEAGRAGCARIVTDTVERLTGQRTVTFETWTRANANRFGR